MKFLLILLVLAVLIGGAFIALRQCNKMGETDMNNVPYLVQTTSRAYYAKNVQETDQAVILTGYYAYEHKKWVYYDGILKLSRKTYGQIIVLKQH